MSYPGCLSEYYHKGFVRRRSRRFGSFQLVDTVKQRAEIVQSALPPPSFDVVSELDERPIDRCAQPVCRASPSSLPERALPGGLIATVI
jgi:hypothetical protein